MERSLRLRDNKRRHRARQKEYTAELERKLRELQEKGIQATIEVQGSARKVVHENKLLKELLQHVGVDEGMVKEWVAEREGEDDDESDSARKRACSRRLAGGTGGQNGPDAGDPQREVCNAPGVITTSAPMLEQEQICLPLPTRIDPIDNNLSVGDGLLQVDNETSPPAGNRSPVENISPSFGTCRGSGNSEINRRCRQNSLRVISTSETSLASCPPAPCKLLTHLAANPGADITQMPTASDEEELDPKGADDGISCSNAYRMLLRYATTEPKLDAVAQILEEGCVPNAGPGKGCRVKNKTIWKALDDICL
jgi:hypothetical protein